MTAAAIEQVSRILPPTFPRPVSQAIFEGMQKQAEKLLQPE